MFPGTERPAMTEKRPGQASTVSNREYIFEQKQGRHPQATTSHHMTPHSRGKKTKQNAQPLLLSPGQAQILAC